MFIHIANFLHCIYSARRQYDDDGGFCSTKPERSWRIAPGKRYYYTLTDFRASVVAIIAV